MYHVIFILLIQLFIGTPISRFLVRILVELKMGKREKMRERRKVKGERE